MRKNLFLCALLLGTAIWSQPAAADNNDDMSLIDLFGNEEMSESVNKPKTNAKPAPAAKNDAASAAPAEEDDGIFSFLNFSFLRDKKKAAEFVRKEDEPQESFVERMEHKAEEGDSDASLTLGYMYLYGKNGVEQDAKKAFQYYSMAATQGDKIAINNLGSLYFSGIGTEKDVLKAVQMFERAAKLGNNEAAVNLGFIYLSTPSVNNVRSNIISLFNQAAEGGNITAQYMLGYAYHLGYLVEKNDKRSFELLRNAASEFDEAQYELAQRYINAEGTPRNYTNAVKYLSMAARQGHVKAMMDLGNILAAGKAYQQNNYQAYIWFNIASVYNYPGAAEKRDILEKILKIEEVLQAQSAAENFKEEPSEITSYIRQTFGRDIAVFIDNAAKRENAAPHKSK